MRRFFIAVLAAAALIASAQASAYDLRYPPVRWMSDLDRTPHALPVVRHAYDPLDGFLLSAEQDVQAISSFATGLGGASRKHLPGLKVEAIDTNNFDEVADSTWFTNRIGRYGARPDEVADSLSNCSPEAKGALIVSQAVVGKYRPTLLVQDASGNKFAIHLDPPDSPGKISSPATAAALILSNAGFHVAPHCPVTIDRGRLTLADHAHLLGAYGKREELTEEKLSSLLDKQPREMRAVAIRMPEGRPFGRFQFTGRLYSDKNDRMRHQDRRELRGLRVMSSFIGWASISERSTYDVFIETTDSAGYFEHWLLNLTDVEEPGSLPNPIGTGASLLNGAFALMTSLDAFWGTKIVAKYSDSMIEAIVAAARYPDEASAQAAIAGLKSRRDALIRYWFTRLSPLDGFALDPGADGVLLSCNDLATGAGIAEPSQRRYRFQLQSPYGRAILMPWREADACSIGIENDLLNQLRSGRAYELLVQVKDVGAQWWMAAVELAIKSNGDSAIIAGLNRRTR